MILLADGQSMLRAGLRHLLDDNGLTVVAEAADADAATAAAEVHQPALCLLDAELPGGGLAAVRRIAQGAPGIRIVVLADEATPDVVVAGVRAGAHGVLGKSTSPLGLVRALRDVLNGQAAVPRIAVAALVREFRGGGPTSASIAGRRVALTNRETEVLELLREELTTAQIADELGVSPITVRRHVGSIAAKTGGHGRSELLRRAE
jgi:DNA-binding NarL/FixJ family response regulator